MKKKLLVGLFIVFFICGLVINNTMYSQTSIFEAPQMLSTMRAKEFCSCYFLLKKPEDYCFKSVIKGFPEFSYSKSDAEQSVTFNALWASSTAYVQDFRLGCKLK